MRNNKVYYKIYKPLCNIYQKAFINQALFKTNQLTSADLCEIKSNIDLIIGMLEKEIDIVKFDHNEDY